MNFEASHCFVCDNGSFCYVCVCVCADGSEQASQSSASIGKTNSSESNSH